MGSLLVQSLEVLEKFVNFHLVAQDHEKRREFIVVLTYLSCHEDWCGIWKQTLLERWLTNLVNHASSLLSEQIM